MLRIALASNWGAKFHGAVDTLGNLSVLSPDQYSNIRYTTLLIEYCLLRP